MTPNPVTRRHIEIVESDAIPALDILFAFGPMIPFAAGAVAAWSLSGSWSALAVQATAMWGAAILLFLSGVRRGLSFRTEGGPTFAQMATMMALFMLGLGALACVWCEAIRSALVVLLAGYALIFILDPIAAHRGEAPLYFARLRRLQIPIALISLIALALRP
jgi:hypothetical protein